MINLLVYSVNLIALQNKEWSLEEYYNLNKKINELNLNNQVKLL